MVKLKGIMLLLGLMLLAATLCVIVWAVAKIGMILASFLLGVIVGSISVTIFFKPWRK